MKFNRNLGLMFLLIAILLFSCLGTSYRDGFIGSPPDPLNSPPQAHQSNSPKPLNPHQSNQSNSKIPQISIEIDGGSSSNVKIDDTYKAKLKNDCTKKGINYKLDDDGLCKPINSSASDKYSGFGKSTHTLQPDTSDHKCDLGSIWNDTLKKCTINTHCAKEEHWSTAAKKCVKKSKNNDDDTDSEVDTGSNYGLTKKKEPASTNGDNSLSTSLNNFLGGNTSNNKSNDLNQPHMGSYPAGAEVPASQIPPGQNNMYILKSQIVPPVCPVCPPVLACPSKAKCPACPAPEPVQPCPPCARCPEPSFECKKVPNYSQQGIIGGPLPRPLLNDFSQFN